MAELRSQIARVALFRDGERRTCVRQALEAVIGTLPWATYERVVVKPNLVKFDQPYANTHPDSLDTVLSMVRDYYAGPLTVAEGSAMDATGSAFAAYRFPDIAQRYGARLLDLNGDDTIPVHLYDLDGGEMKLRLARTIVESDCRISLSLPKTHDTVLVTGTLKNMIMGSLVNRRVSEAPTRPYWVDRLGQITLGHGNGWGSDKKAMHRSFPLMNLNLARLAPLVRPHLGLLDGFVAMEGAGPVNGSPVPWGVALASTDPLALDVFAAHLMGYRLEEIGYLSYCAQMGIGVADVEAMEVVGNVAPANVRRTFAPHPQHLEQRRWHHPDAARLLNPATVATA